MGGTHFIPVDESKWPEEWHTTYYKTYGMQSIPLEKTPGQADLFKAIAGRYSERAFTKRALGKDQISQLLQYSCGLVSEQAGIKRRAQPSGGARYPIEVYPIFFTGTDVPPGVYHYDVKNHALDVLWERTFSEEDIAKLVSYDFAKNASGIFLMTAVFARNQNKYGERGYRHILLEAGHIGQNLYLVSNALGIGCCAMSGVNDRALEELLNVDGVNESVVYGLLLG